MLAITTMAIILQCVNVSNQYLAHLKLKQCHMSNILEYSYLYNYLNMYSRICYNIQFYFFKKVHDKLPLN